MSNPVDVTRRLTLQVGAALAWSACTDDAGTGTGAGGDGEGGEAPGGASAGGAGGSGGAGGAPGSGGAGGEGGAPVECVLAPKQTEGPFYLDDRLVRADVTEGLPGLPLVVEILVRRLSDCSPIAGARVDIWCCDARGVYSGFPNQLGGLDTTGETFMRGTLFADDAGVASFQSIYPGWYPGRAVHIHFKVFPTPDLEVTSQLYFPDATTAEVMALPPYSDHGPASTTNAEDGIFAATPNNQRLVASLTPTADGYRASLVVTVED
jgi:protocatechuate 3,4-dioxygenase beta subunit